MISRRFIVPALVAFFALPGSALAQVGPLVEAFVGSGAKTAYLTLDFGNTSFYTFGFRYDGSNVTAGDMISAIDTALPSLIADMPGDRNAGFGRFINGFGYGANTLANFTANFNTPPYFGWNYYVSTSALSSSTPSWVSSSWGIDGRDGSSSAGARQSLDTHPWNGFSWGQYDTNTFSFLGSAPRVAAAATAPEPATLGLLALGLGLAAIRLRRARHA